MVKDPIGQLKNRKAITRTFNLFAPEGGHGCQSIMVEDTDFLVRGLK